MEISKRFSKSGRRKKKKIHVKGCNFTIIISSPKTDMCIIRNGITQIRFITAIFCILDFFFSLLIKKNKKKLIAFI